MLEAEVDLPDLVRVQLQPPNGSVHDLASVLVVFALHHRGRYYYGGLVGLTDSAGSTSITRSDVEQSFAADCKAFPMDYKVPLSACDPVLIVRVLGGQEFIDARGAGYVSGVVPQTVLAMWQAARNASFHSTSRAIDLEPGTRELFVPMVVELRAGWAKKAPA